MRVLILDEHLEDVLVALQRLGAVHVVDIKERLSRWENVPRPYEVSSEIQRWEEIFSRIETIMRELNIRRELGLLEQLFKPKERKPVEIEPTEEAELISNVESIIDDMEVEIREKITRYRLSRDFLVEMMGLKIDLERLRSSEKLYIVLGQTTQENLSLIEGDLAIRVPYKEIYSGEKGRRRFVVIISLKLFEEEIRNVLEERGFTEIQIPEELTGSPSQSLRFIDERTNEVIRRNEDLALKLYDVISCKIKRLRAMEKLGKTGRIFVLEGWIPESMGGEVERVVKEASGGYAETLLTEQDEPDVNVPTLLRGGKIISSFRLLTEMYGLPYYREIDPTPFTAIFFTFFVGLMIGDVSLGLIVLIGGLLIVRGAGSRSENMGDLGRILTLSGISSVIFGFLTGQIMGGAIEAFSEGRFKIPVIWMSPADDPINFMLISITIGIVHIITGLCLGVVNNYINRRFKGIIGDQISILLLMAGVAILVVTGQFGFVGYGILGYALVIGGFIALLAGKGLSGLLEITKIISNVISYVRLLALNMASAWMGRTFVLLSSMLANVPFFGAVVAIFLLIFSQFFLVFISSFSTFAHSLRLHYVEFYGRFFIGGGTRFSPLEDKRIYTKLKIKEI